MGANVVNEARAILTAEDRASAVLAMVARNFDKLNAAAARIEKSSSGTRGLGQVEHQATRMNRMLEATPALVSRAMGPLAGAGAVYMAGKYMSDANRAFAVNERAMTRIGITAESSADEQRSAWRDTQNLAQEVAMPVGKVREGLDALVAAGRSLPDAMAFLPSVARTAQASGAEVVDIARSADAVGNSFKIAGKDMQGAFDLMAAGGKAGKFELKDMARYLPELAPAAAAMGLTGTEGLKKMVAMLQVVRNQTGSAEEAAGSMKNIFAKFESDATKKNFKDMGVDLEGGLTKARKEGKDLLDTMIQLTGVALKGDMSKIAQLFPDMEFARGMRALVSQGPELATMMNRLSNVSGTVARDLDRVTANRQAEFDRMSNAAGRLADTVGQRLGPAFTSMATAATKAMDAANKAMTPGETDEQRLKRIGNVPQTRAEKSIADAERALRRSKGEEADIGSFRTQEAADATSIARQGKKGTFVMSVSETRRAREIKAANENREAYQRRADFGRSEREFANSPEGQRQAMRGTDADRDVDALSLKRRQVSTDTGIGVRDNLVVQHGDPMISQLLAHTMNLAQVSRGNKLMESDEGNIFSMAGAGAMDAAKVAIENAVRAMAQQQQDRTGKAVNEASIQEVIGQLSSLASRLGETVPVTGPKGRVDGLPQGVADILNGGIKAEVKPDQITAKADVDVQSHVNVTVTASPELLAKVDSRIEAGMRGRGSAGISMPHKETSGGFASRAARN